VTVFPDKLTVRGMKSIIIIIIRGTSHIIWKVLLSETGSEHGGDHHWFKRSSGRERPVTGYDDNTTTNK